MLSASSRLLALAVPCILMACSTEVPDEATATDEDALSAASVGVEGDVRMDGVSYLEAGAGLGKPYRALRFVAKAGDRLAIVVASDTGDPMAYVLNSAKKTLASNDDAAPNHQESYIAFDVPSDGTYYVAVRIKGATVGDELVSVRHRPMSGTYTLHGTCSSYENRQPKPVSLMMDFRYDAGMVSVRSFAATPASNVFPDLMGALAGPATGGMWSIRQAMEPRLDGSYISLDMKRRTYEVSWSQPAPSPLRWDASCSFDASPLFAAPVPVAAFPKALEGQVLVAKGMCSGSNAIAVMCEQGSAGRGADGCCLRSEPLGAQPSEITFKVTRKSGVARLQVLAASSASGTKTFLDHSAVETAQGFRVAGVAVPFLTTALPGDLYVTNASSVMHFDLGGRSDAGNGGSYCGADRVSGSCVFAWSAP
jgi:hypothetical protein